MVAVIFMFLASVQLVLTPEPSFDFRLYYDYVRFASVLYFMKYKQCSTEQSCVLITESCSVNSLERVRCSSVARLYIGSVQFCEIKNIYTGGGLLN